MAILTIAASKNGKEQICPKEQDLWNLLVYCHRKSRYSIENNLLLLNLECIYSQMLYIQHWRYKPLRTRAFYYILSFDTKGYEWNIKDNDIVVLMNILRGEIFREYQSMMFLHLNKRSHYHIHIVANPVNMHTLQVCREGLIQTGNRIAFWLGSEGIALQSFTCGGKNMEKRVFGYARKQTK